MRGRLRRDWFRGNDLIVVEDLNIRGLAKSAFGQGCNGCGLGYFGWRDRECSRGSVCCCESRSAAYIAGMPRLRDDQQKVTQAALAQVLVRLGAGAGSCFSHCDQETGVSGIPGWLQRAHGGGACHRKHRAGKRRRYQALRAVQYWVLVKRQLSTRPTDLSNLGV